MVLVASVVSNSSYGSTDDGGRWSWCHVIIAVSDYRLKWSRKLAHSFNSWSLLFVCSIILLTLAVDLVCIHTIFLIMPLMKGSLFHVCTRHHVCPPIRDFLAMPLHESLHKSEWPSWSVTVNGLALLYILFILVDTWLHYFLVEGSGLTTRD